MKKSLILLPFMALLFAGCGESDPTPPPPEEPEHVHSFGDFLHNDTKHWKECECGEKKEEGNHVDSDSNGSCDKCGIAMHVHNYSEKWDFNDKLHWHTCECGSQASISFHEDTDNDEKCDQCGYVIPLNESKIAPEEFLGHKRATELVDGATYYYAVCKRNKNDAMMFINGEEHSDESTDEGGNKIKNYYPYYMSETQVTTEDELSQMAKVTVEFVEGSDKYFNLKIEKEGAKNDGTYIGIYNSNNKNGNALSSIHCAKVLGETYVDPSDSDTEKECYYNFEWLEKYNGYSIKTAVCVLKDERIEEEASPRFIGTGGDYVSMDCSNKDKAFKDDYNLAYFYEVETSAE